VALQGTIDTFPPRDILGLLSGGGRSGRLIVDGDRGRAALWVDQGRVVAAELAIDGMPPELDAPADRAVLEILRFTEGEFVFDAGEPAPAPTGVPVELRAAMDAAAIRLAEWEVVSAAMPGSDSGLALAAAVDAPVTVGPEEWPLLHAVASCPGHTVRSLRARLGADELEWGASLVNLLRSGVVVGGLSPAAGTPDTIDAPAAAASAVPEVADLSVDPPSVDGAEPVVAVGAGVEPGAVGAFPDHFPIDDLLDAGEDPWVPTTTASADPGADGWAGTFSDGAFSGGALTAFDDAQHAAPTAPGAFHDIPGVVHGTDDAVVGPGEHPLDVHGPEGVAWMSDPSIAGSAGPQGDAPLLDHPPRWESDGDAGGWEHGSWDAAPAVPAGGAAITEVHLGADPGPFEALDGLDAPAAFIEPTVPDLARFVDGAVIDPSTPSVDPFAPGEPSPSAADEILRQMSRLSPKAARAIAAALGAPDGEDSGHTEPLRADDGSGV
jgi:hypothetical protein